MSDALPDDGSLWSTDEIGVIRTAVAVNTRRLRTAHHLSLRELSSRTGLSTALLSQIEREVANPTVAVLARLAGALDVTFAELTRPIDAPPEVLRAMETATDSLVVRTLATMMERRRLEVSEGILPPHQVGVFSDHGRGSIEVGYVVRGSVVLEVEGSDFDLHAGDTIRFSAGAPHAYRTGASGATLVTIIAFPDEM